MRGSQSLTIAENEAMVDDALGAHLFPESILPGAAREEQLWREALTAKSQ